MSAEDFSNYPRLAGVEPSLRRLGADALLFRQGDPTFGVFRLLTGRIRLQRVTPDGAQAIMHTARAGEVFAEASMFSDHYHCDAVGVSASSVLVYPRQALTERLKADPAALWRLTGDLARQVQQLRMRIEVRQIRAATERLMQYLRLASGPDGAFRLEGTLKDLAAEVGLTHEALYRALGSLERQGALSRTDGAILVRHR